MTTPESLVRFYGNTDYVLECIEKNELILPHVSKFNDPFDPLLDFVTEFEKNDYEGFVKWIELNKSNKEARAFQARINKADWTEKHKELDEFVKNTKNHLFAVCFCTPYTLESLAIHPKDNLYMWGHYANGHKGVAIEFNTQVLQAKFGYDCMYPIEYLDKPDSITHEEVYQSLLDTSSESDEALLQKYNKLIRSKSKNWEPEREWRFSWKNDETKLPYHKVPLPPSSISTVYLGCAVNEEVAKKITLQTKLYQSQATVYQATKMLHNFSLNFKKL